MDALVAWFQKKTTFSKPDVFFSVNQSPEKENKIRKKLTQGTGTFRAPLVGWISYILPVVEGVQFLSFERIPCRTTFRKGDQNCTSRSSTSNSSSSSSQQQQQQQQQQQATAATTATTATTASATVNSLIRRGYLEAKWDSSKIWHLRGTMLDSELGWTWGPRPDLV